VTVSPDIRGRKSKCLNVRLTVVGTPTRIGFHDDGGISLNTHRNVAKVLRQNLVLGIADYILDEFLFVRHLS